MDHDEKYTMNEEARMPQPESIRCECCNGYLNEVEVSDPMIDGSTFCDSCADNLTAVKLQN